MLGVDRDGFTLVDVDVNLSLDSVELRLLQIVLARCESTLSLRQRRRLVGAEIVPALRRLKRPRRPLQIPLTLWEEFLEESRRQVVGIQTTGCHVHGDLEDLVPNRKSFMADADASNVPVDDILSLAVDAWISSFTADAEA